MIKNMILSLIGTVFVSSLCEMIIPEGNMKKYFRLVWGFVVVCIILKPIGQWKGNETFEFEFENSIGEEEMRAESEAYILQVHKENIARRVSEIAGGECKVFVNVSSVGEVLSIAIETKSITADAINKIKQETGCDNVKILSGDENEN